MRMQTTDRRVYHIVMTAMMMCIIMASIILFRIPIPFTQGYVNLSDAMIFLAVIILGWKYGALAAGLGSMLGDLLAGFAMWAPWSLGIKGGMAILFGLLIQSAACRRKLKGGAYISIEIIAMVLAGLFMSGGYFFAEGIMYGNWAVAALGIPWNIAQFAVGIALAVSMNAALGRTSLRALMAYAMPGRS